jgi:acetolactate synthase-1/2/3 large subunit
MVKPTEVKGIPPGALERAPNAGEYVAEALKEEGVEYVFGVHGGHMWAWLDPVLKSGIKQVTVRHEEAAGYAAEAYSRISGKTGVCVVTVGPGQTNVCSPIHQAHRTDTPMLVLTAGHEASHDGLGTIQEAYGEKLYSSITKVSKRLISNQMYKYWIKRAIQQAWEPRRGPAVLEFELDNMVGMCKPAEFHLQNWLKQPMRPPLADPRDVEDIVRIIFSAQRPCMFVHDGIMWARADKEVTEFAELAQIPVMGRRGGRGAIPEDHPLCYKSPGVISQSDLFVLWGAKLDFYDFWGARWNISNTIQISDDPLSIHSWLPTELAVKADPGIVLKQVNEYIKAKGLEPPKGRAEWIKKVRDMEEKRREYLMQNAERFKDKKPVHGLYLSKTIYEALNDMYNNDVIYCADSFTGWNLLSPYAVVKHAGYSLDSGQQAGIGHSIGHSIGAAIATDKKKLIFAMMGDAGMGSAGGDIETAVRFKLPVVYCVYNNDGWTGDCEKAYGANFEYFNIEEGFPKPNKFSPDLRYDLMFADIGCHGEWVTSPAQIRPALERACRAAEQGKPAVVNVDVSNEPIQAIIDGPVVGLMWSHLPWNEIPNILKKMRRNTTPDMFPWDEYGIEVEKYDRYERTPDDYDITG